jgi:hypothetical protein
MSKTQSTIGNMTGGSVLFRFIMNPLLSRAHSLSIEKVELFQIRPSAKYLCVTLTCVFFYTQTYHIGSKRHRHTTGFRFWYVFTITVTNECMLWAKPHDAPQ